MTKFGELINVEKPVLIDFYENKEDANNNLITLRNVATALGNKAKVLKIDVVKNQHLADALLIRENPTFMIYKNGEVKWRQTGQQDENSLIAKIEQYL